MTHPTPVVFVVDDDPSVLKALTRLLSVEGFETKPYATPHSFLEEYDPSVPGCVVLDVAMPEFSGLDLQKMLAEKPPVRPVIFISGNSDIPASVSAMKGGAVDFLTKPVSDDVLLPAIKEAIRRDQEIRESWLE